MGEDSCVHPVIEESFYLFLMTFPLEFDLLMIGVCTIIKKKTNKQTKRKQNKKTKKKQKKKKKKSAKLCLCLISYSINFLLLGSSLGV